MPTEPDSKRALSLVMKLLTIPGPSGGEARIVRFICDRFVRAGLAASHLTTDNAHHRSHLDGETGNLIVRLPGTMRGPRRLLMAHVDTVPLCVGSKPIRRGNLIRSADRATAVGADNRSGVAAVLHAGLEILRRGLPHPPLTLLFLVQEEVGLVGSCNLAISRLGRPTLAFNFDSGPVDILITGATGAYRILMNIEGIASHAGVHPEDGANAIVIAAKAIASLEADGWLGRIVKDKKQGAANIGVIQGGNATNVVTPLVTVRIEARSHDARFRRRILDTIVRHFEKAARSVKTTSGRFGRVRVESRLDYESFHISHHEPSVQIAKAAIRSLGMDPVCTAVDGGLDANWLTAKGIPTVTLGAGQHHAHTVDEVLDTNEFLQGCRAALHLATATEDFASKA